MTIEHLIKNLPSYSRLKLTKLHCMFGSIVKFKNQNRNFGILHKQFHVGIFSEVQIIYQI